MGSQLTNTLRLPVDSLVTVRVIRNFPYRTLKHMIVDHVNLETTTVEQFMEYVKIEIYDNPRWSRYHNLTLDTMKLYTKAHGTKTVNLIINLDRDDLIFEDESATLQQLGVENETEISFFNRDDYEEFKANPEEKW